MLDNKKIAYSISGDGFSLVFVHGFCEDRSMWEGFSHFFLTQYQVITIDIGGFGASELPNEPTIEVMADQINAVLNTENIKECILIGHSMGGYIGAAFAEKYEIRLAGLVMFHTHPYADTSHKKENRDKGIQFLQKYGSNRYVTALIPQLFTSKFRINHRHVIDNLIYKARTYSLETIIFGLNAMKNRPDRSSIIEELNCPVQFIIGKLDAAIPWKQSIRQTILPNIGSIQILENIGHQGIFEAKEETQNMIAKFVDFCLSQSK